MLFKITGDNTPGNTNTSELDLNNGGWVLIAILACIIVVLAVILFIRSYILMGKINSLKKILKNELNDQEVQMVIAYRELSDNNKTIINDTLKTLAKNNENTKE